jgi:hypothetical protein
MEGCIVLSRPSELVLADLAPPKHCQLCDSACVDRLGAFVTDRLALREEARRYWLRVLWGLAAVVSLLALATLGYIVLSAR